jgi:hypothetical protein
VLGMLTGPEDAELSPDRKSEFPLAGRNSFLLAGIIHALAPVTSARALQSHWTGPRDLASAHDALGQTKGTPDLDVALGPERRQSGQTVGNPAYDVATIISAKRLYPLNRLYA